VIRVFFGDFVPAALAVTMVGYLFGSIPVGYLVGRVAGIDIRKEGSGNIGATNVVRVLGKRYGYPVFVFDCLKGVATSMLSELIGHRLCPAASPDVFSIIGGVSCVLGHSFPIWLGFKGGKGVATTVGVIFGLMPLVAGIAVAVWFITFRITRYVSIASMMAALVLPAAVATILHLRGTDNRLLLYFSLCLAALIVLRHRSNISRLIHGTEPRFRPK
jgi:glycerol-3-phosphate acyltransferase PlsY